MTDEDPATPWWRRGDPWVAAWLAVAAVVWGLHGFQDALSRDSALYVYAGQQVADGLAPYVGVLNRAGPLAHLLPGLGVELGRLTDLGDVAGVRAVFFAITVLTAPLTYLLGRDVFGSRLAGSAAAATLLAFPGLAVSAGDGPASKQPMMLGLLVALLLLTRRRWLAAGVATALATLTWQPVLTVLLAAAVTTVLITPGSGRSRVTALARYLAGGGLTLAVTVGYFLLADALDEFVEGFWTVNASYTDQQGFAVAPGRAWDDVTYWLGWTSWIFVSGCVLSLVLGALALRRRPGADAAVLGAATLAGLAWSLVAFNGPPDVSLLLPTAAAGIGGGVALVAARVPEPRRRVVAVVVIGWAVAAVAATSHLTWTARAPALADIEAEAEALFATLPDDATVFAADAPQPLALTGRDSISRYVLFGEGMKEYVDAESDGGISGYVDQLRAEPPTVVVTSERGLVGFLRPLGRDYVEVDGGADWRAFVHEDADLSGVGPGQ